MYVRRVGLWFGIEPIMTVILDSKLHMTSVMIDVTGAVLLLCMVVSKKCSSDCARHPCLVPSDARRKAKFPHVRPDTRAMRLPRASIIMSGSMIDIIIDY